MAEVVSFQTALSDSTFRTRPNFSTYLKVEPSSGLNDAQAFEELRSRRRTKVPSTAGAKDASRFQEPLDSPHFKRYNDEGDHRPLAPYRFQDQFVDPVSGFLSPGGDVVRGTGVARIKDFIHISDTPQSQTPMSASSSRMHTAAPSELRRESQRDPSGPSLWSSRKNLDIATRARLGGWTSDQPPLSSDESSDAGKQVQYYGPLDVSKDVRDKLALQYRYKSSVQRLHEDVPWDQMLPPKVWAPVQVHEKRPDMVDQRYALKRYEPAAEEWQHVGRSWDVFQTRNGYYKKAPWINFSSRCPRQQHIPLYSGHVGAHNPSDVDDQQETYSPLVPPKRSDVPTPSETAHRPNIPGYAGSTLYVVRRTPAHSEQGPSPPQTTARVHRLMPSDSAVTAAHKRESEMSKMVTLVPPHNPFNKLDRLAEQLSVS